jgi:hypothetical protein
MPFNELNSVEHYIIHQLSGVNCFGFSIRESRMSHIAYRNTQYFSK